MIIMILKMMTQYNIALHLCYSEYSIVMFSAVMLRVSMLKRHYAVYQTPIEDINDTQHDDNRLIATLHCIYVILSTTHSIVMLSAVMLSVSMLK